MTAKKTFNEIDWERDGNYVKHTAPNRTAMKELLDETGPGFCLAKWSQVTMHLGSGLTHSCHHPPAHKIPLDELKNNPSALHNTEHKKTQRKKMLNGKRPSECDFCWRIEDNTGEISDRVLKSLDPYSVHDFDTISKYTGDEDPYPRYVEVSFSNVCNFKCAYCGPSYSSKWVEEIKKHGPYNLTDTVFNATTDVQIKNSEDNPYTDAFWLWLPDALPHLHTLRITGGEPLMSKHTLKVIAYLKEHPSPNLEFAINSNGCPPDKLWKQFTKLAKELMDEGCIKRFTLFVSAESVGAQAEYSRDGMDWDKLTSNVNYFINNTTNTRVTFMCAFNLFSIPTFLNFLEYVLHLKKRYNTHNLFTWLNESGVDLMPTLNHGLTTYKIGGPFTDDNRADNRIGIDIPYVRYPEHLDAKLITTTLVSDHLIPAVDYMAANSADEWNGHTGFLDQEMLKLKRIVIDILTMCKDNDDPIDGTSANHVVRRERNNFFKFVNEYDARRGKNFVGTFPEMIDFYNVCNLEHEKMQSTDG
jgi:hypothetical protein